MLYLCKDNFALLISKHIIWFLTCFSSRTAVQIIAGPYSIAVLTVIAGSTGNPSGFGDEMPDRCRA